VKLRYVGMLSERECSSPKIDSSVYGAPNATICGNVSIGQGTRIMSSPGSFVTMRQSSALLRLPVRRETEHRRNDRRHGNE
jgi:hypothetical protein